jgi:hypothetical protein
MFCRGQGIRKAQKNRGKCQERLPGISVGIRSGYRKNRKLGCHSNKICTHAPNDTLTLQSVYFYLRFQVLTAASKEMAMF